MAENVCILSFYLVYQSVFLSPPPPSVCLFVCLSLCVSVSHMHAYVRIRTHTNTYTHMHACSERERASAHDFIEKKAKRKGLDVTVQCWCVSVGCVRCCGGHRASSQWGGCSVRHGGLPLQTNQQRLQTVGQVCTLIEDA